jgi:hypothetical protein
MSIRNQPKIPATHGKSFVSSVQQQRSHGALQNGELPSTKQVKAELSQLAVNLFSSTKSRDYQNHVAHLDQMANQFKQNGKQVPSSITQAIQTSIPRMQELQVNEALDAIHTALNEGALLEPARSTQESIATVLPNLAELNPKQLGSLLKQIPEIPSLLEVEKNEIYDAIKGMGVELKGIRDALSVMTRLEQSRNELDTRTKKLESHTSSQFVLTTDGWKPKPMLRHEKIDASKTTNAHKKDIKTQEERLARAQSDWLAIPEEVRNLCKEIAIDIANR